MKISRLLLTGIITMLAGCSTIQAPLATRQIHLDDDYGNLKYYGTITRHEYGDKISVSIDTLVLEFVPSSRPGAVNEAVLRKINLIATNVPTPEMPRWTILHASEADIPLTLNESNLKEELKGIILEMPIQYAKSADHLGLSITGDQSMWPVNINLK